MHNVKRSFKKKSHEDQKLALLKISKFRGLAQLLLKQQQKKVYTLEALAMTEQMLTRNCDFAVIWNYRREILQHLFEQAAATNAASPEAASEAVHKLESKELALTKRCVAQENPKSYCTWHHRRWVVARGNCDLDHEVALCTEFLKLDERNFHCWNYRRFIVDLAQVPVEDEFAYTTEKVLENFSNYSSLHYRVSLFDRLIADRVEAEKAQGEEDVSAYDIAADLLREEMELVQNAIFTEPDDQSCWMHVRCLVKWASGSGPRSTATLSAAGAPVETEVLEEVVGELLQLCRSLLEEEGDCKWALLCLFELLSNSWGGNTQDLTNEDNLAERRDCVEKLCTVDPTHLTYYSQRKAKLA
eukprot:INCI20324.1.p1 GENE.INCI20324.1~~INCI20324.1.p1  ORF type:complete len:358 (-),score=73.07 INCI20324.1:125-1198(-)